MTSSRLFLSLFVLLPLFFSAQQKTPFVIYDYDKDLDYKKELLVLKKADKNNTTITTLNSIADLSYYYKDWETAISYYEKVIVENPTAENYFKLGVAAARKSLEVSRFFSVPYVVKAKKSVLNAYRLNSNNPKYLKLLIKLKEIILTFQELKLLFWMKLMKCWIWVLGKILKQFWI